MRDDDDLLALLGQALDDDVPAVDPARVASLRDAVERAATTPTTAVATARRTPPWPLLAAAAAVLIALVVGVGVVWSGEDDPTGEVEYAGPIEGPGGEARLSVVKTGIGRVVEIDTVDLEILPTGEYYELWFVAPTDSAESPDRISAGTFHPDPDGRSRVTFAAAVDPTLYPVVEVTAEPGDGDPGPDGPVVLRTDIG